MGVMPASFAMLQGSYPRRDVKNPALYQYVDQAMKGIPGTPCCVQMSHALNMAGILIPRRSYRRENVGLKVSGRTYFYLLATDEVEVFLFDLCGEGEMVNRDLQKTRSIGEIKKYLANRPGLLLFRYMNFRAPPIQGQFEHTELWNGTNILQRDMAEGFLFARPRVLFWDANDPAKWLVDYMKAPP